MSVASAVPAFIRAKAVLPTIDLDHQTRPQTNEIENISVAWRLAPEMKAAFFSRSQVNPKLHLLRCHQFAKLASPSIRHRLRHPTRLAFRPATLPFQGRDD